MESLSISNREELTVIENAAPEANVKPDYIWDLTKSPGQKAKEVLGKLIQCANLAEVAEKIEKASEYVVKIPDEYKKAVDKGEMFIMHNEKSGKMYPVLMKLKENGQQEIVTPLDIVQQEVIQGNPFAELAQGYQNLLVQQQMAHLTELVGNTYKAVERIESGQMDDRIGLLNSGRNQIALAMCLNDPDQRQQGIALGRSDLSKAQGQLLETLKRRAGEYPEVPKSKIVQFFNQLVHSDYYDGLDKDMEVLQDYYEGYLQSTKLISASYALTGDNEAADKVFEMAAKSLKEISFDKARTYSNSNSEDGRDLFYNNPVEILISEKDECLNCFEEPEMIELKVSGTQLLEVIQDVSEKEAQ